MASFARTILRAAPRLAVAAAPRIVAVPRLTRGFAGTSNLNEIVKKYTSDHEWISLDTASDSNIATIGITTYAASALGDVVYVELPEVPSAATTGEPVGAVESVKSASDILSPVDGEIVEVNAALNEKPGTINRAPEGEGWIVKVKVEGGVKALEAEGLMGEKEYMTFVET
ncbi:glycine cleavage H-protein-domain-containing protein [Tricharina praecox]|uniref:glycine cleavage H-protein-domain-containing protein n=1 Tax=Tricharina praecox TaxID=43433 RepID=UPI00221E7CD1|nr:glycine cleavage H-protein-domain-containing protein [Tricharina praecox]KAI5843671.1 glycine cleavage H-protein-domain-containing protein [Tricharina praecox]